MAKSAKKVAILGTGPAGLMAATRACEAGLEVTLFDRRKAPGRKLLVAGSSGLNITYECPQAEAVTQYRGPRERLEPMLAEHRPEDWRRLIEGELGLPTFLGTSRRWFVGTEGMKAPLLVKAWTERLAARGARFELGLSCEGFSRAREGVELRFEGGVRRVFDAACFCLGGGSWEAEPVRFPALFKEHGLGWTEFESSNCGFRVDWPEAFLQEAEGLPLKNVVLRSGRGERRGDLVITRYGIEGTPVYAAGASGRVSLDLKPDLTLEAMTRKLTLVRENLSPLRRLKRCLTPGAGACALLFHLTTPEQRESVAALTGLLKDFPLELGARQPLSEAISSSGGLRWEELDEALMLRRFPGVFAAGEMLDWDAPTGGFLVQGCVSQGSWAGRRMAAYCSSRS